MEAKKIVLLLRVGVFCTYFGHGAVAFTQNLKWVSYLNTVGFSDELALKALPFIGVLDMLVAFIILIRPTKAVIIWAILWAFSTALIRPISGESIFAFIERGANWILPLILLIYYQNKKSYNISFSYLTLFNK